jgi:uncharacterized protein YndB with AHSA1/START domain
MSTPPFVIERTFDASIARVWKAITNKDDMKEWYFELDEFIPKPGFEFQFYAGEKDKCYLHLCRVTEVVEGKKIAYSWKYDGYEGDSLVSFELFDEEGKTRLKLTHSGLETFPASNPDLARHNFEKGWNQIIGVSLKKYLESQS